MVNIELREQTAERISAQAEAKGLSVAEFLEQLVPATDIGVASPTRLKTDDLIEAIEEASFDGGVLPADFSRADLYRDHD